MLTPDYSKCLKRSIIYSQRLQRIGFSPTIRYGTFKPEAPRNLWDERWQLIDGDQLEFSHVWVELGIFIIDVACAQFGEKIPHLAAKNDSRYYPIGVVDKETYNLVPDQIKPSSEYRVCEYVNGILLCKSYLNA